MESEQQLIAGVVARDPRAEEEFVRRYESLVMGLARGRFAQTRAAAEEIRQEVMEKLWAHEHRALRAWRGKGRFTSYLTVIVTHLCLQRRQRQARRPEVEADLGELPGADPKLSAELSLERSELLGLVREARDTLSPRDRLVLALRYTDDRRPQEIAALLGLKPGAARKALHDALRRLRRRLHAEAPEHFAAGGEDFTKTRASTSKETG